MERELDHEQKRYDRVIELAPAKETVSMNNVVPGTVSESVRQFSCSKLVGRANQSVPQSVIQSIRPSVYQSFSK